MFVSSHVEMDSPPWLTGGQFPGRALTGCYSTARGYRFRSGGARGRDGVEQASQLEDIASAAFLRRSDQQEYERQINASYVKGAPVDRPAVISVNMDAAAAAVNEFLARLHPYRAVQNSRSQHAAVGIWPCLNGSSHAGVRCAGARSRTKCVALTIRLTTPNPEFSTSSEMRGTLGSLSFAAPVDAVQKSNCH